MNPSNATKLLAAAAWLSLFFMQGCKSPVVRENILSSIQTGVGVTIAENPQTQLYEFKAGYIRSQFYSIPTSKKVEAFKGTNVLGAAAVTNIVTPTPQVVAGIRMNSSAQHLLIGMEIAENFAVGDVAVMSPAATAMYVAQAKAKVANAASLAAESVALAGRSTISIPEGVTPEAGSLYEKINQLRRSDPDKRAKALEFVRRQENGGYASWDEFLNSKPSEETLTRLLKEITEIQ